MLKEYNAGCQADISAPKAPNPFESAAETFNRTAVLVARIELLAERLVGPAPSNSSNGESPEPMGCVHRMADGAMRIHLRLLDGDAALGRIEAVLP